MKTKFTLLAMLTVLAGLVSAQEKKPKAKKLVLRKDSVYGYQVIPKYGNPLALPMPVDSLHGNNVKMPNSYQKGGLEPVPMPTHRVEVVKPKRKGSNL